MKKLAIVILNWNGKDFLKTFLPSVLQTNHSDFELIVIDNNSTDDSVPFLKNNFPSVRVIINKKNYGFAGGYNEGLKQVENPFYILLNSDVEVTPNWLNAIETKLKDSDAGAIQPTIFAHHDKNQYEYAGAAGGFIDYLGYPFCRGRIFDVCEQRSDKYASDKKIFWATGAALAIERKKFWEVGGFDVDLFAHMEEIDLCWRLQNKGYENWVISDSEVYHVGGGTLNQGSPRKDYLNFRNNLIIILKNHYSPFSVLLKRIPLDAMAYCKFLADGKIKNAMAIGKAYRHFISRLSTTLKKRNQLQQAKLDTIYRKSIVAEFFLKGNKTFDKLDF